MQSAAVGNIQFRESRKYAKSQHFFKSLSKGQDPKVFFVTCADSRVDPSLLANSKPGDLFIHRNVGNIIPLYDPESEVCATIEYALKGLNPSDIIVCGHTACGAMEGLINPHLVENMPAVRNLLRHSKDVLKRIAEKYPNIKENNERHQKAIEENVLLQIEHLKTHPAVKKRIENNSIKIHAWVYDISTCEIKAFDQAQNSFLPIEQFKDIAALCKKNNNEEEQEECKI